MPKTSGKSAAKAKASAKSSPRPSTRRGRKSAKAPVAKAAPAATPPVQPRGPLPGALDLSRQTLRILWEHKGLFTGITLVYAVLSISLAQGVAGNADVGTMKQALNGVFGGNFGFLLSGVSVFAVLVSSAGSTGSQTAGAYQVLLAIITSLALIWTLRQVSTGAGQPRVRDAFYRGMYPLIPFVLVLVVVGLQLIPLALGSTIYSTVVNNGIAIHAIEQLACLALFLLLALWTLYMLSASLFALYIVTLPDMAPMQALRSARELVRGRRWALLVRIICLPLVLLLAAAVIMLPIIIIITPLARWVFFILTMFGLTAINAYMYTLYRELLNE